MRASMIYVTVDILVFRKREGHNQILLIRRKNEPFKDSWALPGGFVDENEDLEPAAKRELWEETQIEIGEVEQLKAFGKPFRDPRGHMVTIAFWGKVSADTVAKAADDAKEIGWFQVDDLPKLAFDHDEIIAFALKNVDLG